MPLLLSSRDRVTLEPIPTAEYREELIFAPANAMQIGIRHGEYGILKTPHPIPDVDGKEDAVRLLVGNNVQAVNTLRVSSPFFDQLKSRWMRDPVWELYRAENYQTIRSLTLEPSVELESLRNDLKRMRRDAFDGCCLFAKPGDSVTDLKLRVSDHQAYFNVREIQPGIAGLRAPTIFGIEDRNHTELNLFVPHRKGGIDMVIVVDGSGSMDLCDYINHKGEVKTRIQGARLALETLLQNRIHSGSRVSRFALVVFGKDSKMVYPPDREKVVELDAPAIEAMRRELPNLVKKIDRNGTDVVEAMDMAAELLYQNAQQTNEKVIILLSDGAHWTQDEDANHEARFRIGHEDPVMFADNLYDEGQIRIHTVAISSEENLKRYVPHYADRAGAVPNPRMLEEISRRTRAKFFSSPDAEVLNKLFEDLGQGALFPIT